MLFTSARGPFHALKKKQAFENFVDFVMDRWDQHLGLHSLPLCTVRAPRP